MDETLLLLAQEVRARTLWQLDGVSDEMARFAAPGLVNSILWHAGHALVVVEHLALVPATGRPAVLPDGWDARFGWDSRPAAVAEWPTVAEVAGALREQLHRLTDVLPALTPEQLAQVVDPPRTLRFSIVHGLHDEAAHQGEMYLLRKMYTKRRQAAAGGGGEPCSTL
jgi:hypothetical protein